MLNGRNLVVDTLAEVYPLLKPSITHEFWDFASHDPVPDSIYVLGRRQVVECREKVRNMAQDPSYVMIFCNAAEGSNTLREQCQRVLQIDDLILQKKLLLISGGDLPENYTSLLYDHFLCCIVDYQHNLSQMKRLPEIFSKIDKPYRFLFLNGRGRPHRKYLLERFKQLDLLNHSLYTYLDGRGSGWRLLSLVDNGLELLSTPNIIRSLPAQYEVERYRENQIDPERAKYFAKSDIFNYEWGEIYLQAEPYIDTYFSIVTETVFEEPWSFRTEKIAKVLAQGHPWICATSRGWYRDLRNIGFRTFHHIIDESFDLVDHHQDRMERIVTVVQDLCGQDLGSFLAQCEDVCKYNQQHLIEFSQQHRLDFPSRFQEFVKHHG
jgi:hypothetical protein